MGAGQEWIPHLIVIKDGQAIDDIRLEGRDSYLMGRHQNCDIVVGHASTSRHHIKLQVLLMRRALLLTDLDSVHGTMVNGNMIQSLSPTIIKEEDVFQLGASTRSYKIQWFCHSDEGEESDSSSSTSSPESSLVDSGPVQFSKYSGVRPQEIMTTSNDKANQENKNATSQDENRPPQASVHQDKHYLQERAVLSSLNGRSPRPQSAGIKKANSCTIMSSPLSKKSDFSLAGKKGSSIAPAAERRALEEHKILNEAKQENHSKLWLRRCNSTPLPNLLTKSAKPQESTRLCIREDAKEEASAPPLSSDAEWEDADEYPSDKENVAPQTCSRYAKCQKPVIGASSATQSASFLEKPKHSFQHIPARQPFKPLFYLPSPGAQSQYKPVFQPAAYTTSEDDSQDIPKGLRRSTLAPSVDDMLRRLQICDTPRRQWHIVVDTNCLLDEASFKSLKQLEGVRETRLIIPKIVIRELDFMKREKAEARAALNWIEDCMTRLPSWIHVQSIHETRPVVVTPPVSPSVKCPSFSQFGSLYDLMSPTNDDHVLDCALLFGNTVSDGQVALVTNDTALKIKAMAEGLVSESATPFCESLLNPYGDRFLWSGSTAHGPNWCHKAGSSRRSRSGTPRSCTSETSRHKDNHLLRDVGFGEPQGLQLVLD